MHELAHSGEPVNGLVDQLCTVFAEIDHAVARRMDYPPVKLWAIGCIGVAQWACVALPPATKQAQYPVEIIGDGIYLSTSVCPVALLGLENGGGCSRN